MIYIQSNTEKTLAHHFDCSCALYGAIDNAENYRLTSFEEVNSGKLDSLIKTNLFVGSTEFMREVFKRVGLNDVRLPRNSNRKSKIITLKEAHEIVTSGKKIFIKPIDIKLFSGLILDGSSYTCLNGLPDDTKVLCYDVLEGIESEWRLYIHNHKITDSRNYSGSFMKHPDYSYAEYVIRENKNTFPCAYTVDIGILKGGENVVVEFNDMWAIGNYGIPNDIYLRMLKDRYREIML